MRIKKKGLIICAVGFAIFQIVAFGTIGIIILDNFLPQGISPFKLEQAEKCFLNNHEDILLLTEFLIQLDYEEVHIRDTSGYMFTGLETGDVKIKDSLIASVAKKLLDENICSAIEKEGNTISFIMWENLRNVTKGVAYLIDGTSKVLNIDYLVKSEPLKETGWYYFEADYYAT